MPAVEGAERTGLLQVLRLKLNIERPTWTLIKIVTPLLPAGLA
jgi:hypothetical protein